MSTSSFNSIGAQGSQGNQGFQGTQGNQGFQGTQGNQGFQGTQGNQGSSGAFASTFLYAGSYTLNQTVAGKAFTTVINPSITDAGSNYNASTGIYTVPSTGTYAIFSKIRLADNSAIMSHGQGVHTSNIDGSWFTWNSFPGTPTAAGASAARFSLNNTTVVACTSGDQLRLYCYLDTTSSTTVLAAELIIYRVL